MKHAARRFGIALFGIAFVHPVIGEETEEVLTNADIVALSETGLPASVVLAKIGATKADFDTSVEQLIALSKSGVDATDDSTLRLNAALMKRHAWGKLNLVFGAGFTTLRDDNGLLGERTTEERIFIGGRIYNSDLGEDEEAFIGLSMARDYYWAHRYHTPNRWVVDARYQFAKLVDSDKAGLSARLYADMPMNGSGPSDISIAILAHAEFDALFK